MLLGIHACINNECLGKSQIYETNYQVIKDIISENQFEMYITIIAIEKINVGVFSSSD